MWSLWIAAKRRFLPRNSLQGVSRPRLLLRLCLVSLLLLWRMTSARGGDADVIINEIMYHPPNDLENLQYVELFNRGQSAVDISNWAFAKGIKFVFPAGTRIAAGTYLVACRNRAAFAAQYGKEIPALGDFSGKLNHRGDHLDLCDAQKKVVDWV